MNKRELAQTKVINKLSIGPALLLPTSYWCLVKIQRFQEWYIIPLIAIPLGLVANQLILMIIRKKNPDILKVKNEKGFKLSHFTVAISVLLSLLLITAINVFITVDVKTVKYKINRIGERGTGRNRTSYVEIIHKKGKLEKIDLARQFVESLGNQDSVSLVRYESAFGLIYHNRY